jgi:plastocyanin
MMAMLCGALSFAQGTTLTARVSWAGRREESAGRVVVWLAPADQTPATFPPAQKEHLRLEQKNKTFVPHLLVVPVGSVVEFPNHDPFFHNVFSLFDGKRFDLGLYEAGTTRNVHFDKPGVSYIFCNIHSQMSAVVIAVPTPYYAVSDAKGQLVLADVPAGRYVMHLWYEGVAPEELDTLTRTIVVTENSSSLGLLRLKSPGAPQPHKNKYGRDYDPPTPNSPGYEQP